MYLLIYGSICAGLFIAHIADNNFKKLATCNALYCKSKIRYYLFINKNKSLETRAKINQNKLQQFE